MVGSCPVPMLSMPSGIPLQSGSSSSRRTAFARSSTYSSSRRGVPVPQRVTGAGAAGTVSRRRWPPPPTGGCRLAGRRPARRRHLGLVELPDERRQQVAGLQVEVVARAVEVGRHQGDAFRPVLAGEAAAQLDAGDLGDGVGAVGLLERAGEEVLLLERLRRQPGIDAGAAQEDEPLGTRAERLVDDVHLDGQVLLDEFVGVLPVRQDAAHAGGGQDHGLAAGAGPEEVSRLALVGQVELGLAAGEDVLVAAGLERAHDRASHQAGVARHIDGRGVHGSYSTAARGGAAPRRSIRRLHPWLPRTGPC